MTRVIMVILTVFLAASAFAAEDTVKVVAVVGDQVISSIDLDDRMSLVMATTGIPDAPETRARLIPQVLHQLVDEKLQMQDAAANNITISDEKLHEMLAKIEKQNGKPPGSLEQFIESRGVSKNSFFAQIRAQAAWAEIIGKKIRPRIKVSDQEVARYVVKHKVVPGDNQQDKEVFIATIVLPVDSPRNETSVRKVADKLYEEIRAGVKFDAVAGQFSSLGSSKAADPFWVEMGQLDPAIAAALARIAKGGITEPVKTENGYQIIKLVDMRVKPGETDAAEAGADPKSRMELAFRQVIISPKAGAKNNDAGSQMKIAKEMAAQRGWCKEKALPSAAASQDMDVKESFIRRISTDVPDKLRDILAGMKVGGVSEPMPTPEGVRLFALCERTELPPEKPAEKAQAVPDEVARQEIYTEKLELEAQKYMRNLRRDAFIELRGL